MVGWKKSPLPNVSGSHAAVLCLLNRFTNLLQNLRKSVCVRTATYAGYGALPRTWEQLFMIIVSSITPGIR
jgi:hypothetical protein